MVSKARPKRTIHTHPDIQTASSGLGPEAIVALRGARTRADFAELVGVSPLTVYRWELPASAKEARRPRGQVLSRLRRLAASAVGPDELGLLLPVLARVFDGEGRRSEAELIALMASGQVRSPGARGLLSAHLSLAQLFGRNDARAAFATLAPALADLDAGRLLAESAAAVHLAAACLFAAPIGELFDPVKVSAHAAEVHAQGAAAEAGDARFLAWAARLSAAFLTGDHEQILRLFAGARELIAGAASPLARLQAEQALAMEALLGGDPALATQRLEALAARAGRWPTLRASALSLLALRALDALGDPALVLARAAEARAAVIDARLLPDAFALHASRAEAEALLRLGRLRDAELAYQRGEAAADELRFPPIALWASRGRLALLTGDAEGLARLAERLRAVSLPPLAAQAAAHAAHQEARAALVRGEGPLAVERYGRALDEARRSGWIFLLRDLATELVAAQLVAGAHEEALAAARRAERVVDRVPSPLLTATLRLLEGLALARLDRRAEALPLVEAAQATLALAGDRPATLLARLCLARLSGGGARAIEDELAALGVVVPHELRIDTPGPRSAPPAAPERQPLLVPIERLCVRGVPTALLQREIVAVAAALLPEHPVRLEEIDSTGRATLLLGDEAYAAPPAESIELGDGCGRRYRLVVAGLLSAEQRACLATLASVAGLALEIASLRGLSTRGAPEPASPDGVPELPGVVAASPAMRRLLGEIARLSASRATVIISGESGSGKEIVARAVHDLSSRAQRPYLTFNCAACPAQLFESLLFGHRRGAFTGAAADHPGVIRAAHGGTLFLDEIGELPLDVQAKLLRFLENGEVQPLGEPRPVPVDVRVIAASHHDLAGLVRARHFREDLYYRLEVVPLHVPPLRERPEDILALARHFLARATPAGHEVPVLSPDAGAALLEHRWPGNVRELRNVLERVMAFAPLPRVLAAHHLRLGRER